MELQQEFDFSECERKNLIENLPRVSPKNRNYLFYEFQKQVLLKGVDKWILYPFIKDVCLSLAKKECTKIKIKSGGSVCIPDLEEKAEMASLDVMELYNNKMFFCKKLENVCFHKVRQELYNKNLQLNERAINIDDFYNLNENGEIEKDV